MGFIDNFTSDTPVTIKHDEYYSLMREAAKAELLLNGIKAGVPNRFLEAIATGEIKEGGSNDIFIGLDLSAMTEAAKEFAKNKEAEAKREGINPDKWSCETCTKNLFGGTIGECETCEDGSHYEEIGEGKE